MCLAMPRPEQGRLAHNALLYRTDEELVHQVRQFARAGRAGDEPVLLAFTGPVLGELRRGLGPGERGLCFQDFAELAANPSRILPVLRDWVDDHPGPVRIAAEPLWRGRDPHEATEVIRHEALVNLALADASAQTLCAYHADALPGSLLDAVERTHRGIVEPQGGWRPSAAYTSPREVWENPRRPLPEPEDAMELAVTEDLGELRVQLQDSEVLARLPRQRRPDLVLAISEAAANALRYDRPPRTLRLWRGHHRVVAEVSGAGRIEDPLSGRRRPGARASRGWGLWVINQVCDLVELRQQDGRVRLRMHMRCA